MKYPVLGLVLFAFSCATHAASFDCKKAQSKMEKAICENPKISKLDEELAESYQAAKGKLSADAQKVFVAGQRSWVKFLAASCFTDSDAKPASKEPLTKVPNKRPEPFKNSRRASGKFTLRTTPLSSSHPATSGLA